VWAVSTYFEYWRENFDVSQEQISVLYVVLMDYVCYAQTLCVLNTDANFEYCRQGFHVSQIQILVVCMVASNCVCHAQTLSVFNIDITAQAWMPEIDVGEALGALKIDFLRLFWRYRSHLNILGRPWMAPGAALNRFFVSQRNLPGDFGSLGRPQGCRLPNLEDVFDHLQGSGWPNSGTRHCQVLLRARNPEICRNIVKTMVFTRFWQSWSFNSSSYLEKLQ